MTKDEGLIFKSSIAFKNLILELEIQISTTRLFISEIIILNLLHVILGKEECVIFGEG